jgi:ferredoxin/flavodoxin---NADP+ reductase
MAPALVPGVSSIVWTVKGSLNDYVAASGGSISRTDVEHSPDGFVFRAGPTGPDGALPGAVEYAAHGGMLRFVIANPSLVHDDEGFALEVAGPDGRLLLARLTITEQIELPAGQTVRAVPTLTQAGATIFDSFYPTGTELDPLQWETTSPSAAPQPQPTAAASPRFAIVGSGPAGCYTAQALRKDWPDADIIIFDRLPVPYGLVRYGVAPDHQSTKTITRQFDRLFERDGVRFAGNVHIGNDLTLEQLREAFDAVVLATGLSGDRLLGVPGDNLDGVYGSASVTRMLNSHPDAAGFTPQFGKATVIVGNGNIAMDLLRILAKRPEDFAGSDLHDDVLQLTHRDPVTHISIVGRSPAHLAKFDTVLLRELAALESVAYRVYHDRSQPFIDGGPGDRAKAEALDALASASANAPRVVVEFHFGWTPESVGGDTSVTGMRFRRPDGSALEIAADSVITAIGFAVQPGVDLNRAELVGPNADATLGRLDEGLYCTGWCRRGPSGTIAENRRDAKTVAAAITAELHKRDDRRAVPFDPSSVPGALSFDAWRHIDRAETAGVRPDRTRVKLTAVEALLQAAKPAPTTH